MSTVNLTMETGKLMSSVANLQTELVSIKKEIHALNSCITTVHDQLVTLMETMQTKKTCERLHEALKQDYVQRSELAPVKTIIGAVSVTTATAICVALLNLILK